MEAARCLKQLNPCELDLRVEVEIHPLAALLRLFHHFFNLRGRIVALLKPASHVLALVGIGDLANGASELENNSLLLRCLLATNCSP